MHHQELPCAARPHQVLSCAAMHYHAPPSTALCCHVSPSTALCCHALPCTTKYCPMLAQLDHGITPIITHRHAQALSAPCPQSISATCTVRNASRPSYWPSEPTSDPTCESHYALLLLGSSHGRKETHEALPHVDP